MVKELAKQQRSTSDHSHLISRGYLVLGVALLALLLIPFLTNSDKQLTGRVAEAMTEHQVYLPKGLDDESIFEKQILLF